MANTQGIAHSFKSEVMAGRHALGTTVARAGTGADTVKAAFYLATATIGPATTAYTTTGEVSGTGYTAGGVTVTNATAPTTTGTTGHWTPSASIVLTNVTLSSPFDCVLLYNASQGDRAIGAFTFGAQTVTNGTFTLSMPANDASNALVRIG